LQEYLVDAFQRTVLYLELLRRRGNQEEEIESQSMATVLHFRACADEDSIDPAETQGTRHNEH
jgi:hypothetical protein